MIPDLHLTNLFGQALRKKGDSRSLPVRALSPHEKVTIEHAAWNREVDAKRKLKESLKDGKKEMPNGNL